MRTFDLAWYQLQRADSPVDRLGGFSHFREVGSIAWCSPSPLFDVAFYLRQAGPAAFASPYAHYENHGAADNLSPHPLIDAPAYRQAHGLATQVEILAYAAANPDAPPLNDLFDQGWYEQQRGQSFVSSFDAFADYVAVGQARDMSPFSLFDPVYYRSHSPFLTTWPFEDYWTGAPDSKLCGFPLADPVFLKGCESVSEQATWGAAQPPISRLLDPFEKSFSVEFSLNTYLGRIVRTGLQTILHSAAAVANKSPRPQDPTVAAEQWEAPLPADHGQPRHAVLTSIPSTVRLDAENVDLLIIGSCRALSDDTVRRLAILAGLPGVGMVGGLNDADRKPGAHRHAIVPFRSLFAINRETLRASGGFDPDFASASAASADLALRLSERGFRNLEMIVAPELGPIPKMRDMIDSILLFDRHAAKLKIFETAERLSQGGRF